MASSTFRRSVAMVEYAGNIIFLEHVAEVGNGSVLEPSEETLGVKTSTVSALPCPRGRCVDPVAKYSSLVRRNGVIPATTAQNQF